ncbi:hypothetical protein HHK36_005563 [Tetracentron sinense]|uniref:Gnk2-homologous domain-containing protein n=1 Tax=Tetracentron sinense TaxID=13715 RepID=A0A835DR51_TETSI|nr:hypothetical protein HHK36_005563 [Tetracentron sinense]
MVSFGLIVFLTAIFIHLGISNAQPPYFRLHICSNSGNYTTGSQYRTNLNSLVSSLSSNATPDKGFYNVTAGQSSDEVSAIYLCRGDLSPEVCHDYVNVSSREILQRCPYQKEAIIWYDECMFRYSNRSIFATLEDSPTGFLWNPFNNSDPVQFNQILADLMEELVTEVVSDTSKGMFAAREANLSSSSKIYGMMQCTPDISTSECNRCLRRAVSQIPDCCEGKRGGRVVTPSCILREERNAQASSSLLSCSHSQENFKTALLNVSLCNAQPPYFRLHICSNSGNYTTGSQYRTNFNSLVSSLSSNATLHKGFYNVTAGQSSDEVSAIYLCRGDLSPEVCHDYVNVSSREILRLCPYQKEAIIWYDECLFRYYNRSIFATMEDSPFGYLWNQFNNSDPVEFNRILGDLMEELVTEVVSDTSKGMFAAREANLSSFSKIYGMMQCTPDISTSECNRCLRGSVSQIPTCCEGKRGGRVVKPSCILRVLRAIAAIHLGRVLYSITLNVDVEGNCKCRQFSATPIYGTSGSVISSLRVAEKGRTI